MRVENEPLGKDWERRFGRRLKDLRTAKGWTQDDLAKRMTAAGHPMHQTTVAKIESGNRPTPVGEIAALAAILDFSISLMFSPDNEVQQMLLKLMGAAAEVSMLGHELNEAERAPMGIRLRLKQAEEDYQTLLTAARDMPELQGRLPAPGEIVRRGAKFAAELKALEDRDGEH